MNAMMIADVSFLFVISICCMILAAEDGSLTKVTRIPMIFVGAFAFGLPIWLLGEWIPGPSGFPPMRLGLDGAFMTAAVCRTVVVLVALYRNSGRLFAFRPFGVTADKKCSRDHVGTNR